MNILNIYSLLSGAELIYFFTIRIFFDVRKEKNKVEEDSKDYEKMEKDLQSEFFDKIFEVDEDNQIDMDKAKLQMLKAEAQMPTAEAVASPPTPAKIVAVPPSPAKPATAKPATAKPATVKPATAKLATAKPATAKPAAAKPVTAKP